MKKAVTAPADDTLYGPNKSLIRELGYLTDDDICVFNKWTRGTLASRRRLGTAPPSSKLGHEYVTSVKDFHAWIARQKRVTA